MVQNGCNICRPEPKMVATFVDQGPQKKISLFSSAHHGLFNRTHFVNPDLLSGGLRYVMFEKNKFKMIGN